MKKDLNIDNLMPVIHALSRQGKLPYKDLNHVLDEWNKDPQAVYDRLQDLIIPGEAEGSTNKNATIKARMYPYQLSQEKIFLSPEHAAPFINKLVQRNIREISLKEIPVEVRKTTDKDKNPLDTILWCSVVGWKESRIYTDTMKQIKIPINKK